MHTSNAILVPSKTPQVPIKRSLSNLVAELRPIRWYRPAVARHTRMWNQPHAVGSLKEWGAARPATPVRSPNCLVVISCSRISCILNPCCMLGWCHTPTSEAISDRGEVGCQPDRAPEPGQRGATRETTRKRERLSNLVVPTETRSLGGRCTQECLVSQSAIRHRI